MFSLPYNQRTLFQDLSEKSFEVGEARSALPLQKVLSLFNGQNKSECHGFVSQRFLSHFTTDIFPRKLGTPFRDFLLSLIAPLSN